MATIEPVRALDPSFYTDASLFARERERVFFRTWQYAGHVSDLPEPGDYFTFEVLDQSLFCVRGRDGEVRTYYNVCQHRAHQLLAGAGNKRALSCPYHGWTYELDGRLRAAPNAAKVLGFDRSKICLTAVRTEIFCGFVFVNLDDEAEPMADWYPGVREELRSYLPDVDRLRRAHTLAVEERCNWKVTVENYSECYHCRLNHPALSTGVIDPASYNIVPRGHCLRHTTSAVAQDAMSYPIDASRMHALEYSSWFLWPTFSFQVYPGNVLNTYHWRPFDIRRTFVTRDWYAAAGEGSEVLSALARRDRETTVAEDIRLVESVQRGLENQGYRPSPLVIDPAQGLDSEHSIAALYGWLHEALDAAHV